jgi:hypothetical protein
VTSCPLMRRQGSPVSVLLERDDPTFDAVSSFDEITAAGPDGGGAAAKPQTAWQRLTAAAWFPHAVLFNAQVNAPHKFLSRLAHAPAWRVELHLLDILHAACHMPGP